MPSPVPPETPPTTGFIEASRERLFLRMIIDGVSGAGKTATGLLFSTALARHYGGRVAVIDTERGRALAYQNTEFAPDGFLYNQLSQPSVDKYRNAIKQAATIPGVKVLFIDSLTHAWTGEGGLLEETSGYSEKEAFSKRWDEVGRKQNRFVNEMTSIPLHVIATMRVRTDWFIRSEDGKTKIDRVGVKPNQRKDIEYEFGIYCRMDEYHTLSVQKSDCSAIDRLEVHCPTMEFMSPVIEWLQTGRATTEVSTLARVASPGQLHEYYELLLLRGHNKQQVDLAFYRKYGSKPDQCSEDFLEERLEELRRRPNVPRPNSDAPGSVSQDKVGDLPLSTAVANGATSQSTDQPTTN